MKRIDQGQPLPAPGRLRLSGVVGLYCARIRRRWPQELLAVVGIAVGVALLFASQVASTSLSGPVKQLSDGLVGEGQLQLVGRGPDGFPASTAEAVRKLPGVRVAAPVLQVQANLVGPRGARGVTVFGADPNAVELRGSLLRAFTSWEAAKQRLLGLPKPIADAIGVRFGDSAQVQIGGRTIDVPIATVDRGGIGGLADTSIAIAPTAFVQDLARLPDRISRVIVQVDPGRIDAVRDGLVRIADRQLDVRPADYESQLFDVAAAPTSQATTISSVLSALVGFLFAFCAMLVTVSTRRALAIDLRLDGYRPRQVVWILLLDALVISVIAIAIGLVGGELLSRYGYGSSVSFLGGAFPLGDVRVVTWSSYAVAVAGGLLAATLGVLAPIRRTVFARVPHRAPTAAGADDDRTRTAMRMAGVVLLLAAIVTTLAAPGAALVGLIALALSLILLLPSLLAAAITGLRWLSRRREMAIVSVELALQELRNREWQARSLAIALTGAIAVFGAVALQGARSNLQAGLDGVTSELGVNADLWVSPVGAGDVFASGPFPPTAAHALSRLPGVRSVALYRAGFLDVTDRRAWVIGSPADSPQPIPAGQLLEGDLRQATARLRAGGWATLSRTIADDLDLTVGDRFTLPALAPITIRLAAVTTNVGWSGGTVILNADDYARAWRSEAIGAYQVRLRPGTSVERQRALIADALGPGSSLRIEATAQRLERQDAASRGGLSRLSQIASLTLIAAMLAMAAAMAGLLWQRRSIVSRLKLDGHGTGLMWRALAVESGVLFGTGCLAGAVFGLLGQVLFSRGLEAISGFPVIVGVRVGVALLSFVLVVGVALIVIAVPGYLVARVRPSLRTGD